MSKHLLLVPIAAAFLLAGCVTVPTGPAVTVLPGSQKNFDQFRAEDADCRNYAYAQVGGPGAAQPANDAAVANAAAGTAIGAAVGAIIGAASGQAGPGAAIGAGTGLLFGSAAGSNSQYYSQGAMQRTYDVAYMQCMYARGNQVPGRVAYRAPARSYSYPAPGYPSEGSPAPSYPPASAPAPNYPPPNTPPPQ